MQQENKHLISENLVMRSSIKMKDRLFEIKEEEFYELLQKEKKKTKAALLGGAAVTLIMLIM